MCVIYQGAGGEYVLLFPDEEESAQDIETNQDTLYSTALHWTIMENPPGLETFYFVNSTTSLSELSTLVNRYQNAPPKGQAKLSKRIQEQIDALDPDVQDDLSSIVSQLDKPVMGGVAFRGDDDGSKVKELSVTHECSGVGGIAFQKIVLDHK